MHLITHSQPSLDLQRTFDVAVVIPTVMRDTLSRAVESIFTQDLQGSIQILLGVDDPGANMSVLDALIEKCPGHIAISVVDPGYSTFVLNGGLYPIRAGGVLRTALSYLANARHVAYLDDDNWWAPNHLSTLKKAIRDRDWAFSLRWFVDHKTGEMICIDDWESAGPGGGLLGQDFFPALRDFEGSVDTNVLMIDKMACEPALPFWSHAAFEYGGPDLSISRHLANNYSFDCTYAATCYYAVDPKDTFYDERPNLLERARLAASGATNLETRFSHLAPRIDSSCRDFVVRNLPKGGVGALIGSWSNDDIKQIADATGSAELHLVDPSEPCHDERVSVHRRTSECGANIFPDDHFDWIYLGGDRSYEDATQRLQRFGRKVKPGGWIAGDSYGPSDRHQGGVQRAVDEFLCAGGVELLKVAGDRFVLRKRPGLPPRPRNEDLTCLRQPTISEIRKKTWQRPASGVWPHDFWTHEMTIRTLAEIEQLPNLSLYCFDHSARHALFVETPPETDLTAAPVYYRGQYENARRFASVPYELLNAFCRGVECSPIFIFSIGCSGATLLWKLFELTPGVESVSEPGAHIQISALRGSTRHKFAAIRDRRLTDLLRWATNCLQKTVPHGDQRALVVKLPSRCMGIADMVPQAFPNAKLIFLHRGREEWARESVRLRGCTGEELVETWNEAGQQFRRLADQGTAVFPLSYEDLWSDPANALADLHKFCGLGPAPDAEKIRQLAKQSSQPVEPSDPMAGNDHHVDFFLTHTRRAAAPFGQ